MAVIENGVNVQALLDAREVLADAPGAAQFTWKATSKWEHGVHSTTRISNFFGLGEDYEDTTTTMYVSSRPCQTSKRVLSATDASVISGLYATAPAAAASSCGAHVARSGDTNDGALAASCLLGCAAARRLRRRQQRSAR